MGHNSKRQKSPPGEKNGTKAQAQTIPWREGLFSLRGQSTKPAYGVMRVRACAGGRP